MNSIFEKQKELQLKLYNLTDEQLEDVAKMYYSATAMMVEIGELLQSDTRWKKVVTGSPRPTKFNKEEFLEEYADVMLYLLNVAIFNGLSYDDIINSITRKQEKNFMRLL